MPIKFIKNPETLPMSTPSTPTHPSSKSNTITQHQPSITNTPSGDIPPPRFINSINQLRSFSAALSAFITRYDELQDHINFINLSIDSKLADHVVDETNPNQAKRTCFLDLEETCCDERITGCTEGAVLERNPKESDGDCDWRHAIGTTTEGSRFLQDFEETGSFKLSDDSKSCEEIDVFEKCVEVGALRKCEQIDVEKKHVETDSLKKTEETVLETETDCDETITEVEETVVSEKNPNGSVPDCERIHKNEKSSLMIETVPETCCDETTNAVPEAIVSEKSRNRTIDDCERMPRNARTFESIEEIDASKEPEDADTLMTEETVSGNSSDQTTTAVPEGIVLDQNVNEMVADCEQIHENTSTPESLEEIDESKKPEESVQETSCDQTTTAVSEGIFLDQNPNGMVTDCGQMLQSVTKNYEEIDSLKESEETVLETYCDQTITAVVEAVVSKQNLNKTVADFGKIHEDVRAPESLEEETGVSNKHEVSDVSMEHEETITGTSCDQTITAVQEAIVLEQSPDGMTSNCKRSHENMRTPESLEEIDVSKKPEVINALKVHVSKNFEVVGGSKNPELIDVSEKCVSRSLDVMDTSKNPEVIEATKKDVSKNPEVMGASKKRLSENPEVIDVSKKPEANDASKKHVSKNPEVTCVSKKPEANGVSKKHVSKNPKVFETSNVLEEIDTLRKHEETGIRKKATETKTSKNYVISELEFLCQSMSSKEMKRHVAKHISEMLNLRHEIANALKLAKDPAALVLDSIGRFYVHGSGHEGSGFNLEHQKAGRLASVLILECFLMISSDGIIKISKRDREYAAAEAVTWRKRMIRERGLRDASMVDARGLLLLISGFGIQDHVFTTEDITDLIRASNVKKIATALRCSVFLIPKMPEVISFMVKNKLEIEAVDIAYTLGLEELCRPRNILKSYLHNKIKDVRNGSYSQMLKAMKQQLFDLKSVRKCLESHNIDPSKLLPEFEINERIHSLEKQISEGKLTQKRKSSEHPTHHEPKRACFGQENMPHQQKHAGHYDVSPYGRSTPPSTRPFDFDRNLSNSYNHSPSVYTAPAMPEKIHVPLDDGPASGFHGSYDQIVHAADVQHYGSRGQYVQLYSRHGQTYDSQSYVRPCRQGAPESLPRHLDSVTSPGFSGRQGLASELYGFTDIVEKDARRYRLPGSNLA